MSRFQHLLDRLWMVVALAGGACVIVMSALITYGVVRRYFFHSPEHVSLEVSTFLLVAAAFLSLAYTQHTRGHVHIDLLLTHLPKKVGDFLLNVTAPLIGMGYCAILSWQTGKRALFAAELGERSGSALNLPMFPERVLLPIGTGLLGLVFALQLVQYLADLRKPADMRSGSPKKLEPS